MVDYISHRGNVNGPSEDENSPEKLIETFYEYSVECDVRVIEGELWLGHDIAQYRLPLRLIQMSHTGHYTVYLHAKNFETFEWLLQNIDKPPFEGAKIDFFYHTNEDFVMTHKGSYWVHPNQILNFGHKTRKRIFVMPESSKYENVSRFEAPIMYGAAVCTDYIKDFDKKMREHYDNINISRIQHLYSTFPVDGGRVNG